MKVLFLDESGDHNLTVIDPEYPIFVLGGVIVDQAYADGELTAALNEFKSTMFGRADIVLHTADITRNRNGFEGMSNPLFRAQFYRRLNTLMRELSYSVVACVIRKDYYLSLYGRTAIDPYLLSFDVMVERLCWEIGPGATGGEIVAERRDPTLDRLLDVAWLNLKIQGTHYMQASQINDRILSLSLRDKKDNIGGLQLADLVVSPIGRHFLGKTDREDWSIVEGKIWRNPRGEGQGDGLLILPKEEG